MNKKNLARVFSAELEGIDARLVDVEIDINVGLSAFTIVGLADKSVSEARERVSSAIKNSNIKPPSRENRRVVINLAPADVRKNGSQYDVAMAIGYLLASDQIKTFDCEKKIFIGELGLNGEVRHIPGVLNICQTAKENNFLDVFIPESNRKEASFIDGINIFPVKRLIDLIAHLEGSRLLSKLEPKYPDLKLKNRRECDIDFSDINGQNNVKRALTIAAAGGHNILIQGTPGAGKTMLAKALVSILPDMNFSESIEVMRIWSSAGLVKDEETFSLRPFRAPHHSSSLVSIIGGGQNPKPGEISLAHRGVLFLDEVPEFGRGILESLRQPLEDGYVTIARARKTIVFPARIMLVTASNPCPCGFFGDSEQQCKCSPSEISKYQKRLSGPLLDRIDIQIWAERIKSRDFHESMIGESSYDIRQKVNNAREKQTKRYSELKIPVNSNSELNSKQAKEAFNVSKDAKSILNKALDSALISARGFFKTLKVAQTIADLSEHNTIEKEDVAEALSYRVHQEQM